MYYCVTCRALSYLTDCRASLQFVLCDFRSNKQPPTSVVCTISIILAGMQCLLSKFRIEFKRPRRFKNKNN